MLDDQFHLLQQAGITPILALTTNAMDHQLAEYCHVSMDSLVAKPIEIDKLFSAISSAINPRSAA